MTTRQDAWYPQHDALLLEVTLRHIREGSTQLLAFEEVGVQLGRTAAACGFRWNATVRKQHDAEIQLAKAERLRRSTGGPLRRAWITSWIDREFEENDGEGELSLPFESVLQTLRTWKQRQEQAHKALHALSKHAKYLEVEVQRMRHANEQLEMQLLTSTKSYQEMREECLQWKQRVEQMRKQVLWQPEWTDEQLRFKMDENGNLERLDSLKIEQRERIVVGEPCE